MLTNPFRPFLLCALAVLASCASSQRTMALTADLESLDMSQQSVALVTLETVNDRSPSYHPNVGLQDLVWVI